MEKKLLKLVKQVTFLNGETLKTNIIVLVPKEKGPLYNAQ